MRPIRVESVRYGRKQEHFFVKIETKLRPARSRWAVLVRRRPNPFRPDETPTNLTADGPNVSFSLSSLFLRITSFFADGQNLVFFPTPQKRLRNRFPSPTSHYAFCFISIFEVKWKLACSFKTFLAFRAAHSAVTTSDSTR